MGVFGIFSKTALTILFIFLQKEDITVLHICANFQVNKNFSFRDIGKNRSKVVVFGYFTKSNGYIWFLLLVKGEIILSHMCANFQVQKHFRSGDIGAKGVKKGGFRAFLKK